MEFISDSGDSIREVTKSDFNQPKLQLGSYGPAVLELQRLLTNLGIYNEKQDGIFAKITHESVKNFQRQVFQEEDGIVRDETWQALYKGGPVNLPKLKKAVRENW